MMRIDSSVLIVPVLVIVFFNCWMHKAVSQSSSTIPIDARVPFAPRPIKSHNKQNLIYELHVSNYRSLKLELTRIEIFAENSRGKMLKSYEGKELMKIVTFPGKSKKNKEKNLSIDGGRVVVAFMHVETPLDNIPKVLHHRLYFKKKSDDSNKEFPVDLKGVQVVQKASIVLGPPLKGGPWLVANGLSNSSDHRRALIPLDGKAKIAQRFATDWAKIGKDGKLAAKDPGINRNWYGYGAEVLAVADAQVVAVQDGIPENSPLESKRAVPINLSTICGNYVVLDLGKGNFALYGHLQPKSISVKVGQRIKAGKVIGLLGNSGNSDAPHLHLHIANAKSPLSAEGLPYVFANYRRLGKVKSIERLVTGKSWTQANQSIDKRQKEMPLNNDVIQFDQ